MVCAAAAGHVSGTIHSFCSHDDQTLLQLGTSIAGTYDNVWGESAGLNGFSAATRPIKGSFVEHAYQ